MDSVFTVIAASLNSLCSAEHLVAGSIKADLYILFNHHVWLK